MRSIKFSKAFTPPPLLSPHTWEMSFFNPKVKRTTLYAMQQVVDILKNKVVGVEKVDPKLELRGKPTGKPTGKLKGKPRGRPRGKPAVEPTVVSNPGLGREERMGRRRMCTNG